MKSRTKKSRKHIRRSAVASLLVLSSCLGAAQVWADDYYGEEETIRSGDMSISAQTVTLSDGKTYSTIWGSSVTVNGNGKAITGGNKVTVSRDNDGNDTNGAVVGSFSSVRSGGTARANGNIVKVSNGTHKDVRGGWVRTYGACTNESSGNYVYLTDATLGTEWMSTGDASAYDTGTSDVDSNKNHLTVSGGSAGKQYIGGYAGNYTANGGTADASENSVSITNSSAPDVKSGWANLENSSGNSNANKNQLTIIGASSVISTAYSGYAYSANGGNVNANENKDNEISSSASIGTYSAGYATTNGSGTVTSKENSTTVNNATVTTYSGGTALTKGNGAAVAQENTNKIENSAKITTFSGGSAEGKGNGSVTAYKNDNTVNNSTVDTFSGGSAKSNNGTAKANENVNKIENSAKITEFTGGTAETTASGTVTAYKNSNTVTSSTVTTFTGGSAKTGTTGDATAEENQNTLTTATVTKFTGGYAETGTSGKAYAYNNTSTITGGSVTNIVGGHAVASSTAEASKNTTTVKNNTAASAAFTGGHAEGQTHNTVTANDNTNTIEGGTYSSVRGGWADLSEGTGGGSGTTQNNTLNLTDATINNADEAGFAAGGDATNDTADTAATLVSTENTINMSGGSVTGQLYAGHSYNSGTGDATASSNTFNLKEGADVVALRAGNAYTASGAATASENHVLSQDAKGGDLTNVYGGYAETKDGAATAEKNEISLNAVTVSSKLTGGYAVTDKGAATASKNYGTITSATVSGNFTGGLASVAGGTATASTNIFSMEKGTYGKVIGGQAVVTAGTSLDDDTATAEGNQITLKEGTSTGEFTGAVVSVTGTGAATATDNTATFDSATSTGTLTAATAQTDTGSAEATSNTANVKTGGTYKNLTGGQALVAEGSTEDIATASSNSVVFDDATISEGGTVYGGTALVKGADAETASAVATKNTVHLAVSSTATAKAGDVYGGVAEVESTQDGHTLNASINGIDITNGTFTNILGGYAVLSGEGTATASNNGQYKYTEGTTEITNKGKLISVTADQLAGGLASVAGGTATASTNIFTMEKGTYGKVIGGQAVVKAGTSLDDDTATAEGNQITLKEGTSTGEFTGAVASVTGTGAATATENTATFESATSTGTLTAATARTDTGTADASSNTATVKTGGSYTNLIGGAATVATGGGEADQATALSNNIVFNGASISTGGSVYGGWASLSGNNESSGKAKAEKNTVQIAQAASSSDKAGSVFGGLAAAEKTTAGSVLVASSNGLQMENGTYTSIYGGYAVLAGAGTATANSNGGIASDVTEEESTETVSAQDDIAVISNELVMLTSETEADDAGSEEETAETITGTLTNVTTDSFAGGVASVGSGTSTAKSNVFTFEKGLSKNAAGGKAQITAGSSSDDVAKAVSNKLVLNNGTSEEAFTGGIALVSGTGTAQVSDNEVLLTDATSEAGTITGAAASAEGGVSDAHENTVTITGGTYYNVNGGQSITGTGTSEAVSNVTSVENAVSAGSVTGGSSSVVKGSALAQKNRALLSGGTYANLFGGQAGVLASYAAAADSAEETSAGQADESAILLTSLDDDIALLADGDTSVATVADDTAAEETADGSATATENELVVTNASVSGAAAGGYGTIEGTSGSVKVFANSLKMVRAGDGTVSSIGSVNGGLAVAENGSVEVYENIFELDAGTYNDINGSNAVILGEGTATATSQVHELNYTAAVQYSGSLVAGKASVGSGKAVATANKLTLQGTYTGSVVASQAMVTDAASSSDKASATDSSITVNDAVIYGELHGGFAYVNGTGSAEVSDIKVILNGGQYGASISAGYILATDASVTATALNNTLVLNLGSDGVNSPVFNARETVIYGGYATTDGSTSIYANASNVTSRFEYVKGMTAANIRGFTNYEFNLPDICAEETILKLTGGENSETTSIANATVSTSVGYVYGETGGRLQIWDKVYLLKNSNGMESEGVTLLPVEYTKGTIISRKGILIAEGLLTKTDENSLFLTTEEPDMDRSGAKAISEGGAAGLALASTASDTVIETMRALDRQEWFVFGRISGGRSRYETGSSIDLATLAMVAGVGKGFNTGAGFLTVGGFLEYGTGSYTTHNSFARHADVDGDGQSRYMGGGILARMDFKDTGPGHFYADASAHMGNLHNAFDSNDITDDFGRVATFDYDTPYYSIHGSLGYQWNITDEHMLDLYGQYIWTKVEGVDADLSTGDIYKFDDMNSNRLRLGATYSYKGNSMFSPYVGLAWEHEFSGSCEATVYGVDVASPSFRGDTFRGELGIKTVQSENMPVTLNLGVTGFTGVRNGVSGNFYFRYDF